MTRIRIALLIIPFVALALTACEQLSIAEQERIREIQTVEASTPTATPVPPTDTPTPLPPTATSTSGPTPTPPPPTPTPEPTPTPLPPTPTPNPILAQFSLCNQQVGDPGGGRFSMRVTSITTTVDAFFERLELTLDVPADSVLPHASARCRRAPAASQMVGEVEVTGAYLIEVQLDGWLRDDAFRASLATPTIPLSGTQVMRAAAFRAPPGAIAGAQLVIGVDQPFPFRLRLEDNPLRLVIDVATSGPVSQASDLLRIPAGAPAAPVAPMFYLADGDIWRISNGAPENLTERLRAGQFGDVTALTTRPNAPLLAFCATAPGAVAADVTAASTLWVLELDSGSIRQLSPPPRGRSCADPVLSPDGTTIAYAVDESGGAPPQLRIFSVQVFPGAPAVALTPSGDEWSRYAPQWLDDARLVYAATAEDGRRTLFLRESDGTELDIGMALLVSGTGGQRSARYDGFGRLIAAPDGRAIAVEAFRIDGSGADLLILNRSGAEIERLSPIAAGFWNRPVAWSADGALYYLSTACASDAVYEYTLHVRSADGGDRVIAAGIATGDLGVFTVHQNALAYVTFDRLPGGPGGPLRVAPDDPAALWYWDLAGNTRTRLVETRRAITALAP
ncbi:TolB family protein [Roseiflexus castenholzii]|uniref:AMIN-like domain-containing protein n=1 Tax=Roseiflexus castenholzii (strain DSM 13941 / HLO8) TaxID=383372 RepID=A7NS97_ROSCS|nr:PD40 domain-containing protein [Roseiflexus castenholzii]ABU60443.1 conserved hypothetical protein [Roseiflexus castenholzii DSM 13941]